MAIRAPDGANKPFVYHNMYEQILSGWSDFSAKTEENEEKLFGLVKYTMSTDEKGGEKSSLQMIISRRRQNLPGATTEEKGDEEFL